MDNTEERYYFQRSIGYSLGMACLFAVVFNMFKALLHLDLNYFLYQISCNINLMISVIFYWSLRKINKEWIRFLQAFGCLVSSIFLLFTGTDLLALPIDLIYFMTAVLIWIVYGYQKKCKWLQISLVYIIVLLFMFRIQHLINNYIIHIQTHNINTSKISDNNIINTLILFQDPLKYSAILLIIINMYRVDLGVKTISIVKNIFRRRDDTRSKIME